MRQSTTAPPPVKQMNIKQARPVALHASHNNICCSSTTHAVLPKTPEGLNTSSSTPCTLLTSPSVIINSAISHSVAFVVQPFFSSNSLFVLGCTSCYKYTHSLCWSGHYRGCGWVRDDVGDHHHHHKKRKRKRKRKRKEEEEEEEEVKRGSDENRW